MSSFAFSAYGAENEKGVGTAYERAVTVLSALGIMQGKTEDDFGAQDSVTRAEIGAVIIRFLGLDSDGITGLGAGYLDVADGYWAKPYINAVSAMGLANGNGDGTFSPEDYVTAEQAAKLLYAPLAMSLRRRTGAAIPRGT